MPSMTSLRALVALGAIITPALSAVISPLDNRAVAGQGWSLQSNTCPSGAQSCGSGSCCPSSSHCQSTGNGEVMACCPSSSNCRGSVEGGPSCADAAWSLWKGNYGNGFCCEVGLIGVYAAGSSKAGTCASSVPPSSTRAQLATMGTGSPGGGGGNPPATTTTTTASPGQSTPPSNGGGGDGGNNDGTIPRAVFAHYMVGTMNQADAIKDVQQAKAVGFDAFALNTHTITDSWAMDTINYLFQAADDNDFKLFMSFDMSWRIIQPSDMPSFLANYVSRPSYYKVNGKPFVSTYNGGFIGNDQWQSGMRQPMTAAGNEPFFVPEFGDWSGYPNGFFDAYPVVDGAFTWESAWPTPGNNPSDVTDAVDGTVMNEAHAAGKVYMMPLSSFQFKYLGGQNYYRIGEVNMPQRFEQILDLQPDLVELITWNDAGEGHYIGDFYESQIAGSTIGDYANGFDHSGWQQIVTPFIQAYKSGATSGSQISPGGSPVGSMWYRTLLTSASCSSGLQNNGQGQDTVNFAVILPSGGYTIKVYSGNALIGTFAGNKGLNYKAVQGLRTGGGQRLEVIDGSGNRVGQASGTKDVTAQSSGSVCNWNYEVVGL